METDNTYNHPSTSYYVIYTVATLGSSTKYFPVVEETKHQMDMVLIKILNNDLELKKQFFPNDVAEDIIIQPFLAIKKTLISHDYIESEDGVSENQPGRILSKIIPVDFVSEIYFRDQVRAKGKTKEIREIIFQASKGAKVYFKTKKQWLKVAI